MKTSFQLSAGLILSIMTAAAAAADLYPVVRVQTKEGFNLSAIQRAQSDKKSCEAANARFAETLLEGCKTCRVTARQCKSKLSGDEAAAIGGKALKSYSVASPGLRVVLTGSKDKVSAACEQIASQSNSKGAKTAKCVAPGQPV